MLAKVRHYGAVINSTLASTLRGWRGTMLRRGGTPAPEEIELDLYEFEACPFCRLVREAITELQLDVTVYPCPRGGTRFRPRALELAGGRTTFPFLVDRRRDRAIAESRDIVAYLWDTYNGGRRPPQRSPLTLPSSSLASALRLWRGSRARTSRLAPEEPLVLYSFESSPYSRLVRELLCEMEIPYRLRAMAKEQVADLGPNGRRFHLGDYRPVPGGRREAMIAQQGQAQVPFLVDPNTDTEMFESAEILRYLQQTYG